MNKLTVVAGGAGFLGSHLCDRLIEAGLHVLCVDDLSTGSLDNIRHLLTHPRFDFLHHDINTPLILDENIDGVFHLACPASPQHYQSSPINTTRTAVLGTLNMLELAQFHSAPIVFASTSEVYGDPKVNPQPESYAGNVNPSGPRACYDEGKRCAESLCFDFHRQYGLNIKVVRIFNTYGPRMSPMDGRVISTFLRQSMQQEALTIFGNGEQTRSFCYVDDLIEGLLKTMQSPPSFTGPVNLGNPSEVSMLQLADTIITLTGSKAGIRHLPLPEDDPRQRCPDIGLAKSQLDWVPSISLEDGLEHCLKYLKSLPDTATNTPLQSWDNHKA